MATMEALQFDPKAVKLQLVRVKVPTAPGPDEIIVKVNYAGVCGTDLHIIAGNLNVGEKPVIMGHEFGGVVHEVGAKVTNVARGDRVVVDPNNECGKCRPCCSGAYHLCPVESANNSIGVWRDGGFAQYVKVPAKNTHRLPATIEPHTGALCEPLSCISHGWDLLQPVPMGSTILIVGAGIIGNLWLAILHHSGHRRIFVSEPAAGRRDIVKRQELPGVTVVSPDELLAMKKKDPSFGFDYSVDCTGNAKATESVFQFMNIGGTVMVFGVTPPDSKITLSPYEIYKKELKILGVMINPFSFVKSLGFLESMGEKYLAFSKLGMKVFPLSQFQEALDEMKKGTISKAMFKID